MRVVVWCCLLVAAATAQVPPGHFVTTYRTAAANTALGAYEPLAGRLLSFGGTAALPGCRCAIAGPRVDEVLAGGTLPNGNPAVFRLQLLGLQVINTTVFAAGMQGALTGLALLPDSRVLACTDETIYSIPASGGAATPLLQPGSALGCRDMALGGPFAVVVAQTAGAARASIYAVRTDTLQLSVHAINIIGPTAIAFAPGALAFLVGDRQGDIYLLDSTRFTPTLWLATGRGQVDAIGANQDQQTHAVATGMVIATLASQQIIASTSFAAVATILDFDYVGYQSTFTEYGSGCPGSNGLVAKIGAIGRPYPGSTTFGITLDAALPRSTALLSIGVAPLSLPLAIVGMQGCVLLVRGQVNAPIATGVGRAFLPVPIPPTAALAGLQAFCQWFVVDPVNTAGIVTSAGGRIDL